MYVPSDNPDYVRKRNVFEEKNTNNIGSEKNFAWKRKGEKTEYVGNA